MDVTFAASLTYDGQAVSAGDVVVALTYYGDANLDRQLNSDDAAPTDSVYHFLLGWFEGDFNYDGVVDSIDQALVQRVVDLLVEDATQPTFQPRGNFSGGTLLATPGQIDTNRVKGTVTVTGGSTITDARGMNYSNAIVINFNRTDGQPVTHHCIWYRLLTRTGTNADGTAKNGTYNPGAPIYDVTKAATRLPSIYLTRTYGQTYIDCQATNGQTAFVQPDSSDNASIDTPTDSSVAIAGAQASTTLTAQEFLVVDNVVVYQVTWTATISAANGGAAQYACTSSGAADQIPGNPQNISAGNNRSDGNPVQIANPGYVKP